MTTKNFRLYEIKYEKGQFQYLFFILILKRLSLLKQNHKIL